MVLDSTESEGRLKTAFAILAVLAVVAAAWLALRPHPSTHSTDADANTPPPSRDERAAALEVEGSAAIRSGAASVEAPRGTGDDATIARLPSDLRVRSSAGLELLFVEIDDGNGSWERRDLVSGTLVLPEGHRPARLRAPGHRPAAVEGNEPEVVLEPDALLVLEAPDLRACAGEIVPFQDRLRADAAEDEVPENADLARKIATLSTFGFVGPDRWAVAVTSKLLSVLDVRRRVDISFQRRDRRRAWIYFDAVPGARGVWNPPCDDPSPVAHLDIVIDRPADEPRGEVELKVWRVREGPPEAVHERYDWGEVSIVSPADVFFETRAAAGAGTTRMENLPTGQRYSLTARDLASGAYGRLVFEHDGGIRRVAMHEGILITGRLRAPESAVPPRRASFSWDHVGPGENSWSWLGESPDLKLSDDGEFALRSPARVPVQESIPLEMPRAIDLRIEAPGFEAFHGSFDTGGARRLDCGDLELRPLAPQLVLAPGPFLGDRAISVRYVRLGSSPEFAWLVHSSRREPDGSVAVCLAGEGRNDQGKDLFRVRDSETDERESLPFPEDPGEFVVVRLFTQDQEEGLVFRRRAYGRYELAPRLSTSVAIDCRSLPANGGTWTIGWEWRGLWDVLARLGPEAEGEGVWLKTSVPSDGATLWWSSGLLPPSLERALESKQGSTRWSTGPRSSSETGSMHLDSSPVKLSLP